MTRQGEIFPNNFHLRITKTELQQYLIREKSSGQIKLQFPNLYEFVREKLTRKLNIRTTFFKKSAKRRISYTEFDRYLTLVYDCDCVRKHNKAGNMHNELIIKSRLDTIRAFRTAHYIFECSFAKDVYAGCTCGNFYNNFQKKINIFNFFSKKL
jgi:hypothetical protein